jgi:hypothetical protein
MRKIIILHLFVMFCFTLQAQTPSSVARKWVDTMLQAIREDLARPPVQARNLFHVSMAMYDAWAAYDVTATPYLLGKTVGGYTCVFNNITNTPSNIEDARKIAISYAAYRILNKRYSISPNSVVTLPRFHRLMNTLGYDTGYRATNYTVGTPADLGNYIAQQVLAMGLTDSSREAANFQNLDYVATNAPINTELTGNPNMSDPNKWQPLFNPTALDQNGNPINSTQKFEGAEWGRVLPFALQNPTMNYRNGKPFPVYYDPGTPPMLSTTNFTDSSSYYFKKGHTMVSVWSSHHTPDDNVYWDISPNARGNIQSLPTTRSEQLNFYNFNNGGDNGTGYTLNPKTNLPYTPQIVKRGDFTRVVSQYWADGPTSETPPGHWFTFLNKVTDHPQFVRKFEGLGSIIDLLEWDVKAYFSLGAAMHDAAVAAWSIKGWYDAPRPFSMIRKMNVYGQSSNSSLPNYHAGGLPIIPGYIEMITDTDPLAGFNNANVGKMKVKSWIGFGNISNPSTDYAGVDWIEAANWKPYQRATFVTPPFGGYVSGHSTYSRAGAEVLTNITGSEFFPGGLLEYTIPANSGFLFFERGPSTDIKLQWATYRDASNESSLSRIWGGIHPHFDDIPGRLIGEQVGTNAFYKAKAYFTGTILPVTLSLYTAQEKNCAVYIKWQSTEEQNVLKFLVYKSTDGINFNNLIGTVAANGTSFNVHNYQLIDYNPSESGFYKLVAQKLNGTKEQYRILFVNAKKCFSKNDLVIQKLYPNPTNNTATLNIFNNTTESKYKILVYKSNGQVVLSTNGNFVVGNNAVNLNVSNLKKGLYFIRTIAGNQTLPIQKLIKQ